MIIRGVFSMSILNRLKSLFGEDKKEEDINSDVSNTSGGVEVKFSAKVERGVSINVENETSEEIIEDLEKGDIKTSEEVSQDSSEEIVKEVETPVVEEETTVEVETKEVETPVVEDKVVAEVETKEVEPVTEEVEEVSNEIDEKEKDSKDKEDKRDTMTLLTDTELLNDSNRDSDFTAEFIDAGIETVKHCFQCGTCSGGCPSGRRTPYKVRQIVRKCLLGLKDEVITSDDLWMCTTCYTCQERCPRSVKIVEIIKKARNIAAHAGYMAKAHKMTGVNVIKTGHAVPINDATKSLRGKIGLAELPPTTHSYPDALEEVQKLCKITAFDDLIGYDEATGGLKE